MHQDITTVPPEIVIEIMRHLDSLDSLKNMLLCSPHIAAIFPLNARTICRPIALREFSPEAFQVLNMSRPCGMAPGARQHLASHTSDLFGKVDSNLSEDTGIVGYHEVVRLVHDRNIVDGLIHQILRANMQAGEIERLRTTIYHMILLANDFHVGVKCENKMFYRAKKVVGCKRRATEAFGTPRVEEAPRRTTWNPKTVVFDYSALARLPLDIHIRITALFFNKPAISRMWTWFPRLARGMGGRLVIRDLLGKRLRNHLGYWRLPQLFYKANLGITPEELMRAYKDVNLPSAEEYEGILMTNGYHRIKLETREGSGESAVKEILIHGFNIYYHPMPPRIVTRF